MNLWQAALIALQALWLHRLRSAMTMLGIIIGVTAVILLVAIGNGVQSAVNAHYEQLVTIITIKKVEGRVPGGGAPKELRDADVAALERASGVAAVLPVTSGDAVAEGRGKQSLVTVIGSTPSWLEINNRDIAAGSFFRADQSRLFPRVVVLGPTVAADLFGADPHAALNEKIQLNHQFFTVIGVLRPSEDDSVAVMPLNAARGFVYGGGDTLTTLLVRATDAAAVPTAATEVIDILSQRHGIRNPIKRDFRVQTLQGAVASLQQLLYILSLFTASVAAISLFVGGIGVMNTMLVSVTERTQEIGIRRAIGATRRAVLTQFLIESVILTSIGGLVGVSAGIGLSALSATLVPHFGALFVHYIPAVSIFAVVVPFAASLAIGVIAGSYPAYRAARLRPVVALRYQ